MNWYKKILLSSNDKSFTAEELERYLYKYFGVIDYRKKGSGSKGMKINPYYIGNEYYTDKSGNPRKRGIAAFHSGHKGKIVPPPLVREIVYQLGIDLKDFFNPNIKKIKNNLNKIETPDVPEENIKKTPSWMDQPWAIEQNQYQEMEV